MKLFLKANGFVVQVQAVILAGSIIVMAVILVANVICRQVFSFSLSFAEEVGQNLLILITFTGVSYCATTGKHINMLAVFNVMPLGVKKISATVIAAVTSLVMFMLSQAAVSYMLMVKNIGRVTTALQFPIWIVILMVTLGFFFAGIQYLLILIQNLTHKEIYMALDNCYDLQK